MGDQSLHDFVGLAARGTCLILEATKVPYKAKWSTNPNVNDDPICRVTIGRGKTKKTFQMTFTETDKHVSAPRPRRPAAQR